MIKSLTLSFFACFCFSFLNGQGFTYTLTVLTEPYEALTGAVSLNNGEVWDEPRYIMPIGFPFQLNGNDIASFHFAGSGALMIAPASNPDITCAIFPFETDLVDRGIESGTSESPISYKVEGSPGNRIQKVEFKNAGSYYEYDFSQTTDMAISFQLWLHEGSNMVEFHFGENSINDPIVFYGAGGVRVGFTDVDLNLGIYINPHFLGGSADAPFLSMSDVTIEGTPSAGTVYRLSLDLELEVDITGQNSTSDCNPNGTATADASGGTEPYSYEWSNGETTETIENLDAGTYTVTVTDDNGDTVTASITITNEGDPLIVDMEATDETGVDANDGTASATPSGGSPPYAYEWSNGETTSTITDLAPGVYTITVTDSDDCTAVGSVTVNQFGCPDLSLEVAIDHLSCFGVCIGSIQILDVDGGVPPYTYLWSNNATSSSINNLCADEYSVTVTDAVGCIVDAIYEIQQPDVLFANAGSTDETGEGLNDGTAWSAPTGGTPPYTYEWSTGSTDSLITGLAPDAYFVIIMDAGFCKDTQYVFVEAFDCGIIEAQVLNNTCYQSCDGQITVSLPGGVQPVTYLWEDGSNSNIRVSLCEGNYALTVTDAEGCIVTETFTITEPPELSANAGSTNETVSEANDGTAWATPSGGTPPYLYEWSNGSNDSLIVALTPGIYDVTITDVNGCVATQSVAVEEYDCIGSIEAGVAGISCFDSCDASISVAVIGGIGPFMYTWNTGDTTADVTNLCAGDYSVSILDVGQNCVSTSSFTLSQPDELVVTVDTVVHITDSTQSSISLTVTGGILPYFTSWSGPNGFISMGEDLNDVSPGFYSVVITDGNGCGVSVDSIEVKDETVGTLIIPLLDVRIYPNPASNKLFLEMDDIAEFNVRMFSADGRLVYDGYNKKSVDVSGLFPGMYVMKIVSGEKSFAQRIIISR